jgi:nitrite reductase/ring-hydroxylating ferredoxin subunit
MLSKEETELLAHVGPDTSMGQLFRRYWIPALLSEELPGPDCPQVKVRLLGEDLIAFRDSAGRVGLLGELCSHRRASLFYARNEEGGLRCVYHGWKYDVEGNILETPAEPPESQLRCKIKHRAYPCREAAGMVFAYLGPKAQQPLFPTYPWLQAPPERVEVTKWFQDCNYVQAIEGDCDPSHVPFLHGGTESLNPYSIYVPFANEVTETAFGVRSRASRRVGPDKKAVRISHFVMPFIGCNPIASLRNDEVDGAALVVYQTPADDYHTWRYHLRFTNRDPLPEEHRDFDRSQVGPDYRLKAPKRDGYFVVDREMQRTVNFTGLDGFGAQDSAVIESMGPISDRTEEHLGVSDVYVIGIRRFYVKAVKAFIAGAEPPGLNIADSSGIDLTADVMPLDVSPDRSPALTLRSTGSAKESSGAS